MARRHVTAGATGRYRAVLAVDGSTLDARLRKVGLLRGCPDALPDGRMTALLHNGNCPPAQLWCKPNTQAHDATRARVLGQAGCEAPLDPDRWGAGGGPKHPLRRVPGGSPH